MGRPLGSGAIAFLWLASCGGGAEAPTGPRPAEARSPAEIDERVATFNDPRRPHVDRVQALLGLRLLRDRDPAAYRRAYERVKDHLWMEASLADGLGLSDLELKSFVEAIGWLGDMKDARARLKMELHLDRETVRRKRLPEVALAEVALGLGKYPGSESARETLWAALKDPKERTLVRASAMKALQAHHPSDLESRILLIQAAPGDEWLRDLQMKLK
jgi:hypothetical protein